MSAAAQIIASNLRLIGGNGIIAIADLQVTAGCHFATLLLETRRRTRPGRTALRWHRVPPRQRCLSLSAGGNSRNAHSWRKDIGGSGAIASPALLHKSTDPFGVWTMAIVMPEEATYELTPVGSHTATCYRIIDLGTQAGMYGPKRQILVSWELVDEEMTDGRPFTISRRYTLSSSSKATLRGDVEGWLGRTLTSADLGKLDLSQLLGTTCLIGIKHERKENGRTFANVTSVMRRAKAVPERLPCTNEAVSLSLADFREYEFQQLPQWIRDTIAKSPEYLAATKPAAPISTGTKKRLKAILADSPAPEPEPAVDPLDDEIPY